MLNISVLSKQIRFFLSDNLHLYFPIRKFTINFDFNCYIYKPKAPRDSRRRPCWIAKQINLLQINIQNGMDYEYMLANIRLFQPKIRMHISIYNFHDEDENTEKFMELLSYYDVKEVILENCLLYLKSSENYLVSPPKKIQIYNSELRFQKFDANMACEDLKLVDSKLIVKTNCDRLFPFVKRAYLDNIIIKKDYFQLFTDQLEELVLKMPIKKTPPAMRIDLIKKVIQEGRKFKKELKLLSISGFTEEQSVFAILCCNIFPKLEVFKVKYPHMKVDCHRLKRRIKLQNLKKLNLTGCIIKFEGGKELQNQSLNQTSKLKDLTDQELIHIKKEALAHNYLKFLRKRGPEYQGEVNLKAQTEALKQQNISKKFEQFKLGKRIEREIQRHGNHKISDQAIQNRIQLQQNNSSSENELQLVPYKSSNQIENWNNQICLQNDVHYNDYDNVNEEINSQTSNESDELENVRHSFKNHKNKRFNFERDFIY